MKGEASENPKLQYCYTHKLFVMKSILFILLFFSGAFTASALNTHTTPDPPYNKRVCWEFFGVEYLCLTITIEGVQLPGKGDLKLGAEYGSRGDYINLKFPPTIRNGNFTVVETLRFSLCNAGTKTIKAGTKVSIRNGVARLALQ